MILLIRGCWNLPPHLNEQVIIYIRNIVFIDLQKKNWGGRRIVHLFQERSSVLATFKGHSQAKCFGCFGQTNYIPRTHGIIEQLYHLIFSARSSSLIVSRNIKQQGRNVPAIRDQVGGIWQEFSLNLKHWQEFALFSPNVDNCI